MISNQEKFFKDNEFEPMTFSDLVRERIPNEQNKHALYEKLRQELIDKLEIAQNCTSAPTEIINHLHGSLAHSVVDACADLNIPIPFFSIQPHWQRLSNRNQAEISYNAKTTTDGGYVVEISPLWIKDLLDTSQYRDYSRQIEITRVMFHEIRHCWQNLHFQKIKDLVSGRLEKIKTQKPELYEEIKTLLTSKEIDARRFELVGLKKEEAENLKKFLYKMVVVIFKQMEIKQLMKRRKKLKIDF